MTFQQELNSWWFPTAKDIASAPAVGSKAPSTSKLQLPCGDGKPAVITFLRHCGCPFAEKTFLSMRSQAETHSEAHFIAVSQSDKESTDKWLESVGGAGKISIVVDDERELFARWGLGVSSFWHVLNPFSMWAVYKLGKSEGIWNRPTQSGSRWQTAGSFAVDGKGSVTWSKVAATTDDLPEFGDAIQSVQ